MQTRNYSEPQKGEQEPRRRGSQNQEEDDARGDMSSRDLDQGRNGHGSQEPEKGSDFTQGRQSTRERARLQQKEEQQGDNLTDVTTSPHYKRTAEATCWCLVTKSSFLHLPGNVLWYIQESDKG